MYLSLRITFPHLQYYSDGKKKSNDTLLMFTLNIQLFFYYRGCIVSASTTPVATIVKTVVNSTTKNHGDQGTMASNVKVRSL